MANINFGLLDTQYPEKLANAFVRTPEQQNANMLQAMQMQQLMDQREQAQYTINKARREDAGLAAFGEGLRALGPDPDPDAVAQLFIKHPDRAMQQAGVEMLQKAREAKRYAEVNAPGPAFGGGAPESFGAEVATRKAQLFGPPPGRTNMMPGAAVAPAEVNNLPAAFTPPQVKTQLDSLLARRDANLALGTPRGDKTAETLQKQITDLTKLYPLGTVLMSGTGAIVGTAPQVPQQPRQPNLATDLLIPGPNGTMIPNQALIKVKEGLRPTGTTVNVIPGPKVESKYGEKFGALAAEADDKLLGAARSAPKMAENANETLRLLELPTITGSGADIRLALAKAYSLLGDTDQQSIVNTENLIKSTGAATLASIKDAGLGTGQGFTDKDLKFLQGVTGGTIALSKETLKNFARIQHEVAVKIAAMWETRKKNIPKSALEGTGIDKERISIEPMRGYSVVAPDGKTYPFSSPEKAAEFKRQIGMK